MKIENFYVDRCVSLIDHSINGLQHIKELIAYNKDITDNDWLRFTVPITELNTIIEQQNVNKHYCKECIFYSKPVLMCLHPANKGLRILNENEESCQYISTEWTEETKKILDNYKYN